MKDGRLDFSHLPVKKEEVRKLFKIIKNHPKYLKIVEDMKLDIIKELNNLTES